MIDPATEACRAARDQIVQRAGGFEVYFNQLGELDRKRLSAQKAKRKRRKPDKPMPGSRNRKNSG
jgi:hypothetical protein